MADATTLSMCAYGPHHDQISIEQGATRLTREVAGLIRAAVAAAAPAVREAGTSAGHTEHQRRTRRDGRLPDAPPALIGIGQIGVAVLPLAGQHEWQVAGAFLRMTGLDVPVRQ